MVGDATSDNTISDNLLQDLGGGGYGYGIGVLLYNNFYAQVSNNVIQNVLVGVQTGNFSQANNDNSFTPEISNNTISAEGVGVFYNLMYDGSSTITVSDNHITAINAPNDAPWQGVLLTSIQDPTSVSFQDDTIDGSAAFTSDADPSSGYEVWNTPTGGSVEISGGIVTGVDYGVWVNTYEGYDGDADNTQVTVDGVGITASKIGVYVEDSPQNGVATATATIEGDTSITTDGAGTGIHVSGSTASASITGNLGSIYGNLVGIEVSGGSATITNNHIYDNGTGIEFTSGGSGSVTGNSFAGSTANGTDLLIDTTAGTVSIGDANQFYATNYYIQNLSTTPQNFDLSTDPNTTVSGVNLASLDPTTPSGLSTLYSVEGKIVDYLDNPAYGYVRLQAGYDFVAASSETATPGAIQRGVNAANTDETSVPSDGDIVDIQAGTFVGEVDISKNLTLSGAGQDQTTIDPSANLASPVSPADLYTPMYPIVYANSSSVTIEGLTVDGLSSGNAYADGFVGVAYYNAGGTVQNVTIQNVENSPFNGVQNGIALFAEADSGSYSLTVNEDTIDNYQKNGMALSGNGLTVNVEHNIVTGAGSTPAIAQNGIQVGQGTTGTISDNTVSGNEYSGPSSGPDQFSDVQSCGLLLFGTSGLLVSGNIVDGNDIGIYNNTDTATIFDNQLGNTTANRYEGIVEDQGSSTISGNTVKGGNLGIDVATYDGETGEASAAIVKGNTVSNAGIGLEAIVQTAGVDPAVNVLAQNNNLAGNGEGVLISGGATVDLGTDLIADPGHAEFTGLGSSTGYNILTGYTGVGGNYAIDDQNTPQGGEPDVLAEDNNFGPYSADDPGAIATGHQRPPRQFDPHDGLLPAGTERAAGPEHRLCEPQLGRQRCRVRPGASGRHQFLRL